MTAYKISKPARAIDIRSQDRPIAIEVRTIRQLVLLPWRSGKTITVRERAISLAAVMFKGAAPEPVLAPIVLQRAARLAASAR